MDLLLAPVCKKSLEARKSECVQLLKVLASFTGQRGETRAPIARIGSKSEKARLLKRLQLTRDRRLMYVQSRGKLRRSRTLSSSEKLQ